MAGGIRPDRPANAVCRSAAARIIGDSNPYDCNRRSSQDSYAHVHVPRSVTHHRVIGQSGSRDAAALSPRAGFVRVESSCDLRSDIILVAKTRRASNGFGRLNSRIIMVGST